MEFKTIKSIDKFSKLYEMSEDGLIVRQIGAEGQNVISEGRAYLTVNGETKSFSLKTLCWHSWNKPLPYEPVLPEGSKVKARPKRTKEELAEIKKANAKKRAELDARRKERAKIKAHKEAVREEKIKRREAILATKVRKGKLMSKVVKDKLMAISKVAKKNKNKHFEYKDKKIHVRALLQNKDILLVRIETQAPSRCGRFFFNVENDKFVRYDEAIHKPGYGDQSIVWPSLA